MNPAMTPIIAALIGRLGEVITEEEFKKFVDDLLDFAEVKIAETETQVDDIVIGTLIDAARAVARIPDDIGGDED